MGVPRTAPASRRWSTPGTSFGRSASGLGGDTLGELASGVVETASPGEPGNAGLLPLLVDGGEGSMVLLDLASRIHCAQSVTSVARFLFEGIASSTSRRRSLGRDTGGRNPSPSGGVRHPREAAGTPRTDRARCPPSVRSCAPSHSVEDRAAVCAVERWRCRMVDVDHSEAPARAA